MTTKKMDKFMKEEIYNEKELAKLEEEIRAMGISYSTNEPDERYFANFRVRLMERIDANEQSKNIFASIWSWLSSSPLRSLSLGAGLAGVIIAALLIRPNTEQQIAKIEPTPQKVETPLVIPPQEIPQLSTAAPKIENKPYQSHRTSMSYKTHNIAGKNFAMQSKLNTIIKSAENPEDLAITKAVVSGGDSNEPVDLESLSADELQDVLSALESIK
jgi:hypothetical protein